MELTAITHHTHRNIAKDSFPIHNTDVNPIIKFCQELRQDMVELRQFIVVIGAQLDSLQQRIDNIKFTDIPVSDVESSIPVEDIMSTPVLEDTEVVEQPTVKNKPKRKQ